ncbi:hypothetical protein [Mycolicibacterium celeriflavum]|uniref:Putative lipoprotein LppK n=1 Tax=Mycolicibacterium celeriflavum TaxID=1249101 RepID=A0A7I7RCQ4_MYCCF|nr:hypothetical protein [Mycolicibacterium celeriflavum]BBY42223.1 putative lipoprotein LppK [Mycolicibacterium celeriflavum]
MHRTTRAAALSAVAIATALGLCACGAEEPGSQPAPVVPPATESSPVPAAQPPSTIAPLPPPNALTDVLARMADANIPGADKLDLVENATPADGAAMDKFATALRDGGYAPATFEAKDLAWADGANGVVLATVTAKAADPQAGDFTFPMEFRFADNHWQLTRGTADALLPLGENPAPTPTP